MDMRKHLRRWLNGPELRKLGDRYEGRIDRVTEEQVRNRFTGQKQIEPVIHFDDGYRLVPNYGMRVRLIEFWGDDTEDWIGHRLQVLHEPVTDKKTGKTRWQKQVARPLDDVNVRRARRPTLGSKLTTADQIPFGGTARSN